MTDTVTTEHMNIGSAGPLIDDALDIQLNGFMPGQHLTLRAAMRDDFARQWSAFAEFQADEQGCVAVAQQKPLAGSYANADPMGLLWSMVPTGEKRTILFAKVQATDIPLSFSIEVDGETVARVDMSRKLMSADIVRTQVRENGLFGSFFRPVRDELVPAILQFLVNIPLEYFATALDWLQAQPFVDGERLAVMGQSKGGELTLLLGATFPQLKCVVGYVPSAVVWQGLSGSYEQMMSKPSSWSYHGKPLPSVPTIFAPAPNTQNIPPPVDRAASFTALYRNSMLNTEAVEQATIPVEKTNGPILLISAKDDALWPSTYFCEMVMERLNASGFRYAYQHLSYEGAGHLINYPYLPTTATQAVNASSGTMLAYGGNAKDAAIANEDSWRNVLAFLEQHL